MTKVLDPNAWKKQIRQNIVDPVTATHEAGHVVARMLTYEHFGFSLDVFKTYGLVHTLQPPRWLYDDGLTYPQGPISAPFFSYEMERASEEFRNTYRGNRNTYEVPRWCKSAGIWVQTSNNGSLCTFCKRFLARLRKRWHRIGHLLKRGEDMTKHMSPGSPTLRTWTTERWSP